MKISRFPILLTFLILGSFLLSACTGAGVVNSWPGVSVAGKTVYLADAGSVYAIDASNGAMSQRFPEKADPGKPFYASPAVTDKLIVAGTYGKLLYGIDPANFKTAKWTFDTQTGNQVGGNFVASPLVYKDVVLAPASNNMLYALRIADGSVIWSFKAKNALWATPASDGKVVYLPALDHNLYALNFTDGSLVWKKDLGSALLSAPILTSDGLLYVTTMDGDLVAVKAADGSIAWTKKTGGRLWATPAQQGDLLYVGTSEGKVFAVNAKDGKDAWQKDAGSPILAGGAVLPDSVVFVTEGGSAVAYSLDGQKEMWKQTINGKLYTTPVVAGDKLIVAVTQGDKLLQALDLNGQLSWSFVAPK